MFVNLIKKHGLVPQSAMLESQSSSSSGKMNGILLQKLREGAQTLRNLAADGTDPAGLREAKGTILNTV